MRKRLLLLVVLLLLISCAVFFILSKFVFHSKKNPFTDVAETDWFYESVRYAYDRGLMKGTEDGMFSPDMPMQRGMIITILYRLEGEPEVTESCPFTDVPDSSPYATPVTWAASCGIVNGFNGTDFAPYEVLTRQQAATFLYRYAALKEYDTASDENLNCFSDTWGIEDYAADACAWVVSKGLINGTSDTTFNPADPITRAQSAVIVTRFCDYVAIPD